MRRLSLELPESLVKNVLDFVQWPTQVASSFGLGSTVLWQVNSSRPVHVLRKEPGVVEGVAFFPEGDRLLTTGTDGRIVIWSVADGRESCVLRHAERAEVYDLQVFPDGARFASVGSDFTTTIWSAGCGPLFRLRQVVRGQVGRTRWPHRVARVFPDGRWLVSGASYCPEGGATIWDTTSGEIVGHLRQPIGRVSLLEVSPCGRRLATAGASGVWLWSVAREELGLAPRSFGQFQSDTIRGIAFADGGRTLVASGRHTACVWDLGTGAEIRLKAAADIEGIVATPRVDQVVTFSTHNVVVWNTTTGEALHTLPVAGHIRRVAASGTGDVIAACSSPSSSVERLETTVWNVETGLRLRTYVSEQSSFDPMWKHCRVAVGRGRPPRRRRRSS